MNDIEKYFSEDEEKEIGIDFQRYIKGLYRRKWLILGIFMALVTPLLIYLKRQPPKYEAFAVIIFKRLDTGDLSALNRSRMLELRSRSFAEKVVAQLGLVLEIPEEKGRSPLKRSEIFEEFHSSKNPVSGDYLLRIDGGTYKLFKLTQKGRKRVAQGDLEEITQRLKEVNGFSFRVKADLPKRVREVTFRIRNFLSAVKSFRSKIRVRFSRQGTHMVVSMTDRDPNLAAQMVNRLAEIYIEESLSFRRRGIENRKKVLEEQLRIAEANLEKANQELKRFQESHFISLDAEVKQRVDDLNNLQADRSILRSRIATLKTLLDKLEATKEDSEEAHYIYRQLASHPAFENEPTMLILRQRLSDLENRLDRLLGDYKLGEAHEQVIATKKEITLVQSQIGEIAQTQLTLLQEKLAEVERGIQTLQMQLKLLPTEQMKLAELERAVKVNERLYTDLYAKYQEVQISESVETEDIRILDSAIPPEYPINRDKRKKAVLGGFFILVFSLGVGLFLEYMDKSIKTPDDVKKYLKLPVIGSIPKVEFDGARELQEADKIKQIDLQLVTYDYSPTPIGEAYRALRTKLMYSKSIGRIRSLVITSFAPEDGKSFTCSNLAVTLAQHKTNTLLVDSDLRRGVLHNTFSCPKEPGLSNYLMGMVSFEEILSETHVPNLTLVSCGSIMPNPSELLGSLRLKRFIEEARQRFDFIIFDTPPLNAATDAVVLGTQVDGVVLVVRVEVTNRNVAKQKLELFENVPATILGVILNGTEKEMAHEGYSYYHY